jgi:hypothetical protein
MVFNTKYDPGDVVHIVVGSDDKVKIITSVIQSINNVVMAISGTIVTYNCIVNRHDTGTYVAGMPECYTVPKTEDKLYATLEECVESLTKKHKK